MSHIKLIFIIIPLILLSACSSGSGGGGDSSSGSDLKISLDGPGTYTTAETWDWEYTVKNKGPDSLSGATVYMDLVWTTPTESGSTTIKFTDVDIASGDSITETDWFPEDHGTGEYIVQYTVRYDDDPDDTNNTATYQFTVTNVVKADG